LLPLTASNNANDDTTFTSNSLLSSSSCFSFFFCFFPFTQGEGKEEREKRKQEKKRAPNNGPSCACSEHAPNEHNENSEKGKESHHHLSDPHSYCTAGGQCLKRSHTVLITIHAAAAVVQHTTGWPPGDAAARSLGVICNAFWYPILSHT